jgi:hypothetical protein
VGAVAARIVVAIRVDQPEIQTSLPPEVRAHGARIPAPDGSARDANWAHSE